jgi:hypothetical protein
MYVSRLTSSHTIRNPIARHGNDSTRAIGRLAILHLGDWNNGNQTIGVDRSLAGKFGEINLVVGRKGLWSDASVNAL